MARKFSFRIAKEPRNWYGFNCPTGGVFGTDFFVGSDGTEHKYDYVYLGESRKRWRPDGTFIGTDIHIYVHHHVPSLMEGKISDTGTFRPIWVHCTKNSLAMKLLNKHVSVKKDTGTEFFKVDNLQHYSSAIKRPSSAGAIFNMVRERQ